MREARRQKGLAIVAVPEISVLDPDGDIVRHLHSTGRAGKPVQAPPYFIVIDRALRDEGASYHYLPPSNYSEAEPQINLAQPNTRRPGLFAVGINSGYVEQV